MFATENETTHGFETIVLKDLESNGFAAIIPACGGILHSFNILHNGELVNVIDVTKTENFRIQISPNPGNGIFTLQFNQIPGDLKVEILNSIGQMVWERTSINYQGLVFEFNPGQVANGIYLIRTTVNGEVLVHKLIVK